MGLLPIAAYQVAASAEAKQLEGPISSFYGSEVLAWRDWIFCSGSHWADIEACLFSEAWGPLPGSLEAERI